MSESKIFVTSDLHFCHDKEFLYKSRGYNSIQEHDEDIVKKWNSVVGEEDTVYILGDLVLNDINIGIELLNRLNGNILYCIGNHDTDSKIREIEQRTKIECVGYATMLKYRKYNFYLSHYPTITSNYDVDKPLKSRVINLCGHTHSDNKWKDFDKGLIYHCELDAHDCFPVLIDTIIDNIKEELN